MHFTIKVSDIASLAGAKAVKMESEEDGEEGFEEENPDEFQPDEEVVSQPL